MIRGNYHLSAETLRILKAELTADAEELTRLCGKYELMQQKLAHIVPDEFDYVALAAQFFTLAERLLFL